MSPRQDPTRVVPAHGLNAVVRALRLMSKASPLAIAVSVGLIASGCKINPEMQSTLCTNAVGEKPDAICEGPQRQVSLTVPRAALLKKVEVPPESAAQAETTHTAAAPSVTGSGSAAPVVAPAAPVTLPEAPKRSVFDGPAVTGSVDQATETAQDAPKAPTEKEVRKERASSVSFAMKDAQDKSSGPRFSGPLSEAARKAIADHPLIGLADARVREALAGIGVAEAGLFPQLEGRAAGGHGLGGTYQDSDARSYWADKNAAGSVRGEASLSGRQLLYDFGATQKDIAKTSALHESEKLKLQEQIEAVTGQVADIYLKILEQRELLAAATENVAALEKIAKLVEENEKNGNGTVAEIKRVRSRLIDGQTAVADARSELQTGSDRFARLVHAAPGTLQIAYRSSSIIPRRPDEVIRVLDKTNPRVQALASALQAASLEIEAQKASVKPKVAFESDVSVKEYRTLKDKTEVDAKGMVVLRYKFLDGGLFSSQLEQLHSRYVQAEMRMRSETDDVEADIRKQYRVLDSARAKAASLKDNVATALKARQLYDEQFRGGKRSLLELLDIQTTYYTARRTEITNKFEEQRAIHQVLLAMGRLTSVVIGGKTNLPKAGAADRPAKVRKAALD
mgnify:CR=1 FL=1